MPNTLDTETLPYRWYVEPEVADLEQERIFSRSWQYAARADQVAEPGSLTTAQAGSLPVVIVRGQDGVLRAFVNVCRHRGYVLCEGDSQRETIQCPYHAWTYNLDGSLRSAPRAGTEPGFDRGSLGLRPVAVETWGPFVFVNPDIDTGPLQDWLGEVPGLLAADGVDVDALAFTFRADIDEYASNWKVNVENFLECYHCQVAHPSLAQALDVSREGYLLETRALSSSQFGPARNGGNGVYDATGTVGRGQFHFLFPNTVINVMPGRLNLSIGPIVPLAPERTHRFLDYFLGPDADDAWFADYLELDNQVGAEDRVLVERVQRGIRSRGLESGALMPSSERLIAHFQALVRTALA